MRELPVAIVCAAILVLVVAACGDDDPDPVRTVPVSTDWVERESPAAGYRVFCYQDVSGRGNYRTSAGGCVSFPTSAPQSPSDQQGASS